jgi:type IV secretion system protein VirD4
MMNSRFSSVRTFAGEIMTLMKAGKDSFTAPMGVLQSAFAFMRDPRLQWTFSGSDVSTGWLPSRNRKLAIFVIWPVEYVDIQSAAIRCIIGSAIQNKMRAPDGQPVSVLVDEAGQLKRFPSLREIYTFGRGAGLIGNIAAWQEISQIKASFGAEAGEIIGSAQYRVFKGIRTIETARLVSEMAGTMTLEYDASLEQSNAYRQKMQATRRLLAGGSLMESIADVQHYKYAESHRTQQARRVLQPDEVLNLPSNQMVAFASGLVDAPLMGQWLNHYERRDFAGKYLNNPYHGDLARVKTRWSSKQLRVIEETVPTKLEHLPQYQNGRWRYLKGYRPGL